MRGSKDKAQNKIIPKWPFLLGDGLMIITALLLALTNGVPLSPIAMFFCIFAVAWGCLLACAPFILEYQSDQKASTAKDPHKIALEQRCAQLERQLQEVLHVAPTVQEELPITESVDMPVHITGENIPNQQRPSMLKKALHIAEQNKRPKVIERLIQDANSTHSDSHEN